MNEAADLLIVEDEPATRFLLAQIFMMRGYRVRTASDGFEALAMIRTRSPNLLLSDLNMPGMSGFELLSVVRRLYPQIYVVASSGAYSGSAVPQGIAADGFHEKASGMAPLMALIQTGAERSPGWLRSQPALTPLWVSLEEGTAVGSRHVLIHCPECLRPFRQGVEQVNAEIRDASCHHCGGRVEYAIALASQPIHVGQECRSGASSKADCATGATLSR